MFLSSRRYEVRADCIGFAAGYVMLAAMEYDVSSRSTRQLLADFAAIMRALRERGIVRTNNNPIGDIAEAIVAEHYGGERGGLSQPGWDVRLPDGKCIQVKALRRTGARGRRNLSPIRDSDYDTVVDGEIKLDAATSDL